MKQFWLEPSHDLSEDHLRKIAEEAKPHTIILPKPVAGLPVKVASPVEGADILVTCDIATAYAAKERGVPVALQITIQHRNDIEKVSRFLEADPDYLLIDCPNWKIIPVENLIAEARGRSKILARTRNFQESRTALSILEQGTDGISLTPDDPSDIIKTRDLILEQPEPVSLSLAKVTSIRPIGTGAQLFPRTVSRRRRGPLQPAREPSALQGQRRTSRPVPPGTERQDPIPFGTDRGTICPTSRQARADKDSGCRSRQDRTPAANAHRGFSGIRLRENHCSKRGNSPTRQPRWVKVHLRYQTRRRGTGPIRGRWTTLRNKGPRRDDY